MHVDDEPARADQAEAEDVDRLAVVSLGDDSQDPDQHADDENREDQFDHGPGDRAEENPLGSDLPAIMGFQAVEHFAERAGLFADAGHFQKQRREDVAGAVQRFGQGYRRGRRRRGRWRCTGGRGRG